MAKPIVCGPFTETSGYSYVNRSLVKCLVKNGLDIGIENIRNYFEITKKEYDFFDKLTCDGKVWGNRNEQFNKDYVKVVCWIPIKHIPKYKRNIMYTMTETKDVSVNFIEPINKYYDECWLPTQYYADRFKESGLTVPAYVVPIGVDERFNKKNIKDDVKFNFKVFRKGKDTYCDNNPKGFKFLSVFRWTYRKGYDVLLKSFLREFKKSDNVSLIIVSRHIATSHKQEFTDAVERDIRRFVEEYGDDNSPNVYWCHDIIPNEDMPTLYSIGDVFISTSRGEGISLCPLEASMMGLPIIAPNHTGHLDYLREDNSYMIDVDDWILTNNDPGWQGWITELYIDCYYPVFGEKVCEQTSYLMRKSMNEIEESKTKNLNMQKLIEEKYNWDKCASVAEQRLREALNG